MCSTNKSVCVIILWHPYIKLGDVEINLVCVFFNRSCGTGKRAYLLFVQFFNVSVFERWNLQTFKRFASWTMCESTSPAHASSDCRFRLPAQLQPPTSVHGWNLEQLFFRVLLSRCCLYLCASVLYILYLSLSACYLPVTHQARFIVESQLSHKTLGDWLQSSHGNGSSTLIFFKLVFASKFFSSPPIPNFFVAARRCLSQKQNWLQRHSRSKCEIVTVPAWERRCSFALPFPKQDTAEYYRSTFQVRRHFACSDLVLLSSGWRLRLHRSSQRPRQSHFLIGCWRGEGRQRAPTGRSA